MKIYVVVISDRHTDDTIYLHSKKTAAIKRAMAARKEIESIYNARMHKEKCGPPWLQYYYLEDCGSVRVEEKELDGEEA